MITRANVMQVLAIAVCIMKEKKERRPCVKAANKYFSCPAYGLHYVSQEASSLFLYAKETVKQDGTLTKTTGICAYARCFSPLLQNSSVLERTRFHSFLMNFIVLHKFCCMKF